MPGLTGHGVYTYRRGDQIQCSQPAPIFGQSVRGEQEAILPEQSDA